MRIDDLPDGFNDAVYSNTEFMLGFWDRVKLLFGWRLYYSTATLCESCPGITHHWKAEVQFLRPEWLSQRKPCCAVAVSEAGEGQDDGV
jgi:hypothetical protein